MYEICLKLARQAIEDFIRFERMLNLDDWVMEIPRESKAVFVTLLDRRGDLRGSMGTFFPTRSSLAEEILHNAIAALDDERFEQVRERDLQDLRLIVDILSSLEEVHRLDDLDPEQYGVVIKNEEGKIGWLLPNHPHARSIKDQLALACQRGSIDPAADRLRVFRFRIEHHLEE